MHDFSSVDIQPVENLENARWCPDCKKRIGSAEPTRDGERHLECDPVIMAITRQLYRIQFPLQRRRDGNL